MDRSILLGRLADTIASIDRRHPIRVGIDGVDAAGKTTMADELAARLSDCGRQIIRASIDGFHNTAAIRHPKDVSLPESFYANSFNYPALLNNPLSPLGPDGSLRFRRAVFDFRTDARVELKTELAEKDAILLFDGVFLFRPEICDRWDFSILLKVDFGVTLGRALIRDVPLFGSEEKTRQHYQERYIPGQQLYLAEAQPEGRASIIIDNNDVDDPEIIPAANG